MTRPVPNPARKRMFVTSCKLSLAPEAKVYLIMACCDPHRTSRYSSTCEGFLPWSFPWQTWIILAQKVQFQNGWECKLHPSKRPVIDHYPPLSTELNPFCPGTVTKPSTNTATDRSKNFPLVKLLWSGCELLWEVRMYLSRMTHATASYT